jgi:hypothetical protein
MSDWTNEDLQGHFRTAGDHGWIAHFEQAASDYAFPLAILIAIASRETDMRNIIGDGGHGYGIMQIDDRSFPDWCHSGAWKDVRSGIMKGALVLDGKREQVRNGQGKSLNVGGLPFTGATIPSEDELMRIAIAAYNCGLWAYYSYSTEDNPDLRSTHQDYSADTLARAAVFRGLLA